VLFAVERMDLAQHVLPALAGVILNPKAWAQREGRDRPPGVTFRRFRIAVSQSGNRFEVLHGVRLYRTRVLRHACRAPSATEPVPKEAGSRAFALLASVIESSRRLGASVWQYLGPVIRTARTGLHPPLPSIPAAA